MSNSQNKVLLLSLVILFHACSKIVPADPSSAVRESIHQAIALENLSNIDTLLDADTVFIYAVTAINKPDIIRFVDNPGLSSTLPSHIDRWAIAKLDSVALKQKVQTQTFEFLVLYVESTDQQEIKVQIIKQTLFPPPDRTILIDRARLTLVFKNKGGHWFLLNISSWWG